MSRIFRVLSPLAVLAATLPSVASAQNDGYPTFRPGLWEYSRSSVNAPPGAKPFTMRECEDPGKTMREQAEKMRKQGCKISPPKQSGKTFTFGAVCNSPSNKMTTKSVLMRESDSAHAVMIESEGTMGGQAMKSSEVLTAKRIGECPKK